jgi:hypothetical protein
MALRRDFRARSCSRFLSAATALPTSSPHNSFARPCAAVICSCLHHPAHSSAQVKIALSLRLQAPSSAGNDAGAVGDAERDDGADVACSRRRRSTSESHLCLNLAFRGSDPPTMRVQKNNCRTTIFSWVQRRQGRWVPSLVLTTM